MDAIEHHLMNHPFFAGFEKAELSIIAACGRNQLVAGGRPLFYQGDPADTFYVIRDGSIELRIHRPAAPSARLDTLGAGDVAGWSWLVPPHRWMFDAIARQDSELIALDARALQAMCDRDASLGYRFLTRVTQVMHDRLEAARRRLIEVHHTA